ncbi:cytochrome-c oxidase, cbb3-type subunit III [Mangrovitalea sediminis]|uniref:cytochrome-c oxidase, cbb3-type subunit III n=1 Tax=Mangrovitalea sediminis TaxID=1982043 RepID=UPI000BE613D0|nr:cytochrome-c oxidase, cbb3-type subunit III [Mangrovitalea sediminis]
MSTFWSIWVSVIVLGTILGCWWLLWATRRSQTTDTETDRTMGHSFDGIEEYDNPLPKWWFYLFTATVIFSLAYVVLYPTLGNFKGILGWTSHGQWEQEMVDAQHKYGPIFAKFGSTPIPELAKNPDAVKMGQRLFENNCAVCHGSTAHGNVGFPNLSDNDWLYGGTPDKIVETITGGRNGMMPAKGLMPNMTDEQVDELVNYVLSFSGREKDKAAAEKGKALFAQACAACHGPDAKGNQSIGSANLTDNIWLYGGDYHTIRLTILHGRQGQMPAWGDKLGKDRIHIIAAYVYSLSH